MKDGTLGGKWFIISKSTLSEDPEKFPHIPFSTTKKYEMRYLKFLSTCLAIVLPALFPLPAQACGPQHDKRSTDGSSPFTIGSDGPADPATIGYAMNHFSLIVNDLDATMHFYGKVLGMRHIFTYQASPAYIIAYMGYSHGGKNGTGYQTGQELYAERSNVEGLIEFLYLKDSDTLLPTTKQVNTFSHVGLVVPDVKAAEARMQAHGVQILKPIGEDVKPESALAKAYGFGSSLREARAAAKGIEAIGFKYFLLVADPDGNVVEIQQQS